MLHAPFAGRFCCICLLNVSGTFGASGLAASQPTIITDGEYVHSPLCRASGLAASQPLFVEVDFNIRHIW